MTVVQAGWQRALRGTLSRVIKQQYETKYGANLERIQGRQCEHREPVEIGQLGEAGSFCLDAQVQQSSRRLTTFAFTRQYHCIVRWRLAQSQQNQRPLYTPCSSLPVTGDITYHLDDLRVRPGWVLSIRIFHCYQQFCHSKITEIIIVTPHWTRATTPAIACSAVVRDPCTGGVNQNTPHRISRHPVRAPNSLRRIPHTHTTRVDPPYRVGASDPLPLPACRRDGCQP